MLLTDRDWSEVSARNRDDPLCRQALALIREQGERHLFGFDRPDPAKPAATAKRLIAWDLSRADPPQAAQIDDEFCRALFIACYAAWLEADPATPAARLSPALRERRMLLARMVAASARLLFAAQWDRDVRRLTPDRPGYFKWLERAGYTIFSFPARIADAYDFAYPWMTEAQRTEVRDFLYAVGYGRHFSNSFDGDGRPASGNRNNGDFHNIETYPVPVQLVIEGEEGSVSPDVRATFGTPAKGDPAERWMRPADPGDVSAWPQSSVAAVDNLHRHLRALNEAHLTPWGSWHNGGAYMSLVMRHMLPSMIAYARRAENPFITTHWYSALQMQLWDLQRGEGAKVAEGGRYRTDLFVFSPPRRRRPGRQHPGRHAPPLAR